MIYAIKMAYYYPPEESDENTALMDIADLTEGEVSFDFQLPVLKNYLT